MVYHSSDPSEMRLCHLEASRKIWRNRSDMRRAYVELFAKKKTVSVPAVQSLSYAFTLFGMTERGAADLLVQVSKSLRGAPASRGKLLFFGERILTSQEGLAGLQPIRDMLASSYRTGGHEIVKVAQTTMADTAYRTMCVSAGEKGMPEGWDVLGVEEGRAREIWEEAEEEGFKSDAEEYYAYQSDVPEYDKDGNVVIEGMKKEPEDPFADMTESQRAARGLTGKGTGGGDEEVRG